MKRCSIRSTITDKVEKEKKYSTYETYFLLREWSKKKTWNKNVEINGDDKKLAGEKTKEWT